MFMKNSKCCSSVAVIIAVVVTALIVGAGSYYMFNNRVQMLEQQVEDLQMAEQEAQNSEEEVVTKAPVKTKECYKTYEADGLSFDYPCDWKKDVTGGETMSAAGTVVAPDGTASLHYPAPDFGLHGMELTNEGFVTINGTGYPSKTYEGNGTTLVFIATEGTIEGKGYNLMLAYDSTKYKAELDQILSTFEF